jgi:hypothetical protein
MFGGLARSRSKAVSVVVHACKAFARVDKDLLSKIQCNFSLRSQQHLQSFDNLVRPSSPFSFSSSSLYKRCAVPVTQLHGASAIAAATTT